MSCNRKQEKDRSKSLYFNPVWCYYDSNKDWYLTGI